MITFLSGESAILFYTLDRAFTADGDSLRVQKWRVIKHVERQVIVWGWGREALPTAPKKSFCVGMIGGSWVKNELLFHKCADTRQVFFFNIATSGN